MTCLGVLEIEEIRDKDNETGLKEGEGIEISTTSASITRCSLHLFFQFILTLIDFITVM